MNISLRPSGSKGAFVAEEDGQEAGVMTYTNAGPDKFIIDHTEVNDAFAGKGVGKALVMAAVDHARSNGLRILPLCPFAKRVLERDPAVADILF